MAWTAKQWARLVCVVWGSLTVQCYSVAVKQTWPIIAALGYGFPSETVGQMFSMRMFAIMVVVGAGGYVQGWATPRQMVLFGYTLLVALVGVWAIPASHLPAIVFKAMLLAGSGVANVVYVNLNALVQLVDPSQAGLINSIHRSLIMAANTLVPALASHFDIGSVPSALAMHGQAMEASVRMAADGAGLEEAEPGLVETGAAEWPHPHAISRAGNLSLVFACVSVMCAVASLLFCTVQPADDVEETTDAKATPPVPAKKPSTDVCATGIRSPDPPAGLRSRKHRAAAKDSVGDTATDSDVQPPRATTSWFRGFGDLASPRLRFAMLINILTLCVDEVAMVFGAWRITHADELGQSPAFLGMASGASAIMSFTVIMASGKIVDKLISLKNTILTLHVLRVVCLLVMGCSDAIQSICWPRNAQASAMVFAGAWAVHDALWHAYAAPASLWVGRGVIAHHEARAKEEGKVVTDGTRGKALARMFVIEKISSCTLRGIAIQVFAYLVKAFGNLSSVFTAAGIAAVPVVFVFYMWVQPPPMPSLATKIAAGGH